MFNASTTQALDVWTQLERAYYNDNSYGGDEAEIYVYRMIPYSNLWGKGGPFGKEVTQELTSQANADLLALFLRFAKDREVDLLVEGIPPGDWLAESDNAHRWHVKVVHRK